MKEAISKRYYKKINTTFKAVNKQDAFAKAFLNIIRSGNTTLYQKERRERRIFDDSWMGAVEDAIPVLDKLTRNPKENLKRSQMIVPIERAKRIDKDTIRHLSANTQFIKDIDKDGNVMPSKVLTSYTDSDLATYENRFLRSLVDKLHIFVQKRYDLMLKNLHTEYSNRLEISSSVPWKEATIDYDIKLNIHQTMPEDEMDKRNQILLNRMKDMVKSIRQYKMSDFMTEMKEFPPVRPPIMKTNLIAKNTDFQTCYRLWTTLDKADRVGYDVDRFERNIDFKDEYLDEIENAMMVLYATIANRQEDEFLLSVTNPYEYHRKNHPEIYKMSDEHIHLEPGYYKFENNELNQYYLEQIRKVNYGRFKKLSEADVPFEDSVDIIFGQMADITNAAYEDELEDVFQIGINDDLDEQIEKIEEKLNLYRRIEKKKREDLKKFLRGKSAALNQLRLLKEKKRDIKEQEKADEEIKEKERQKKRMQRLEEEKKQEIHKKKKIAWAKKVLREAKERRENERQ